MKSMIALCGIVLVLAPTSSYALRCAWPTVDEAKQRYPVAVMGEVTRSVHEELGKSEQSALLRGYQHVTMQVEHARLPPDMTANGEALTFRETVSMYDYPFFKEGRRYIVFLERGGDGQLTYPVCGFHLNADDPLLNMQEIRQVLGWS